MALLVSSCGGGTNAPAPDHGERLGAAPGDRSLLSLLRTVQSTDRGTFRVRAPEDLEGTHLVANSSGWFWTTAEGVYTRIDVDRSAVDRHVDDVLARRAREALDPAVSELIYVDDEYYRGDEFQFGVGHLVARLGFASQPDSPTSWPMDERCRAALGALEAAVTEEAATLEPRFQPRGDTEVGEFPLDTLERRTTTQRARMTDACPSETGDDFVPRPALRFERTDDGLDVIVDPGIYTSRVEVVAVRLEVSRGGAVPDPPVTPDPADGFDAVNVFIMKIGECGELPWEYSNFAAGNTYSPPDADDYLGPTAFVTDYLCESELPDRTASAAFDT